MCPWLAIIFICLLDFCMVLREIEKKGIEIIKNVKSAVKILVIFLFHSTQVFLRTKQSVESPDNLTSGVNVGKKFQP